MDRQFPTPRGPLRTEDHDVLRLRPCGLPIDHPQTVMKPVLFNNLKFTIWPSMRKSDGNSYRFWSSASRTPAMRNATPIRPSTVTGSRVRRVRARNPAGEGSLVSLVRLDVPCLAPQQGTICLGSRCYGGLSREPLHGGPRPRRPGMVNGKTDAESLLPYRIAPAMKRLASDFGRLLMLLVFLAAAWLLYDRLKEYTFGQISKAIAAMPTLALRGRVAVDRAELRDPDRLRLAGGPLGRWEKDLPLRKICSGVRTGAMRSATTSGPRCSGRRSCYRLYSAWGVPLL